MRTAQALAAIAILSALGGCVRPPPFTPFKTSAAELRERVHTIALAPVTVSAALADREIARAAIEPAVTERLQAGGFAVVPPQVVENLWRRAADDVGGIFDPVTGERDKTRYGAVEAAVYRDLHTGHGVDAVLYLSVTSVVLYLPGPFETYCGITTGEPVYWPGNASPKKPPTLAVALCLNAELADLEARPLYGIRHGVEMIETYAEQTRAVRPIEERLQNHARLAEAIEATVGPLADADKSSK